MECIIFKLHDSFSELKNMQNIQKSVGDKIEPFLRGFPFKGCSTVFGP